MMPTKQSSVDFLANGSTAPQQVAGILTPEQREKMRNGRRGGPDRRRGEGRRGLEGGPGGPLDGRPCGQPGDILAPRSDRPE
jgi:hypothetical protein